MKTNIILNGDALEHLKTFPNECIDCVMTSPPYWPLRDYGVKGQLGLESTFEKYIAKLCNIFDEVKRVLKKTGTCWINLGDTYGGQQGRGEGKGNEHRQMIPMKMQNFDKCLTLIPFRFTIEMVNCGWVLRNTIIWYKPNCMHSSVKDRFTVDFEYLFFFSKSKKYFFETQYEEYTELINRWGGEKLKVIGLSSWDEGTGQDTYRDRNLRPNPRGKNKRTVWKIPTQPFPEAHFAVYPEAICEIPIKAGCPEFICNKCGKAREKILEPTEEYKQHLSPNKIEVDKKSIGKYLSEARKKLKIPVKEISKLFPSETGGLTGCVWNWETGNNIPTEEQWQKLKDILKLDNKFDFKLKNYWEQESFFKTSGDLKEGYQRYKNTTPSLKADYKFSGYTSCNCNAGFSGGIVLDPFFGAGTTGLVALKQNKQFIGIELNPEYIKIANARIKPFLEQEKLAI